MKQKSDIHFFTDQDVPDSIGDYLEELGHSLTRLRDIIPTNSPDPYVAATCVESGAVLVSFNHKDFEKIVRKSEAVKFDGKKATKNRMKTLSRLDMDCEQHCGLESLKKYIDIVEVELAKQTKNQSIRLWIGRTHCRIYR